MTGEWKAKAVFIASLAGLRRFKGFGAGITLGLFVFSGLVLASPIEALAAGNTATWLEQKVIARHGAAGDTFGIKVAVDGDTALVGAPDATVNSHAGQGVVYVFSRKNGVWVQTAKLIADDGAASDGFGSAVAISGSTAFIGAPYATIGSNAGQGAVYVFKLGNNGWTQAQKLISDDGGASNNFGWSIGVSDKSIIVGAPARHLLQGAAYIFSNSGSSWSQVAELLASDGGAFDDFGYSVDISGNKALVGASGVPGDGTYHGAAYVFENSDSGWTQVAILQPDNSYLGDFFGTAVSLDGDTALVGSYARKYSGGPGNGAAFVFSDASGSWTQVQELTASDGKKSDYFGLYVAVDGDEAVIGAPYATIGPNDSEGSAYLFTRSNGTWSQTRKFLASDATAKINFGAAVLDGSTILIGAWNESIGKNAEQGAAYFYGRSSLTLAVNAPRSVTPGTQYSSQTIVTNSSSVASPAVIASIAVPAAASFVSASATRGDCSEATGVVTCDFGQINGNAGMATANVTLKATGKLGDAIRNTASIVRTTPPLTAGATTQITLLPVNLDVSGSVGPTGTVDAGDNLAYTITVQNLSDAQGPATGTRLVYEIPKGVNYLAAIGASCAPVPAKGGAQAAGLFAGGSIAASVVGPAAVSCDLGVIASNAGKAVTITVQATAAASSIGATFKASAQEPDSDPSNNTLTLNTNPSVGPTGPQGPAGPSGPKGPQGPKGDKGSGSFDWLVLVALLGVALTGAGMARRRYLKG